MADTHVVTLLQETLTLERALAETKVTALNEALIQERATILSMRQQAAQMGKVVQDLRGVADRASACLAAPSP